MNKKECIDYLKNFEGNKAKLAKDIGIAIGTFYRIINGQKVRVETLNRVSRYVEKLNKNKSEISMNINDLWQYIDPRIKCICKDQDGGVYGYETIDVIPNPEMGVWEHKSGQCYAVCLLVDFSKFKNWTEMRYIRPNCCEHIDKYGVFSNYKDDTFTILGKLESVDLKMNMPFKRKNGLNYKFFRPLTEEEKGNLC